MKCKNCKFSSRSEAKMRSHIKNKHESKLRKTQFHYDRLFTD